MNQIGRPIPDEAIVRRAYRVLEAGESPMERYLRDEHTAMISAARVGLDAARKVHPVDRDHLSHGTRDIWKTAKVLFEDIYEMLDGIAYVFSGELLHKALLGEDVLAQLEKEEERLKIGPKYDAQPAEPIYDPAHATEETVGQ